MAVTKASKIADLEEIESAFRGTESAILVDFRGLKVPEVTELRRQVRGARGRYKVIKNSLATRAVESQHQGGVQLLLQGVLPHQRGGLGGGRGGVSLGQQGLEPDLPGHQPQVVQPLRLGGPDRAQHAHDVGLVEGEVGGERKRGRATRGGCLLTRSIDPPCPSPSTMC